jgi:hypothetical protein
MMDHRQYAPDPFNVSWNGRLRRRHNVKVTLAYGHVRALCEYMIGRGDAHQAGADYSLVLDINDSSHSAKVVYLAQDADRKPVGLYLRIDCAAVDDFTQPVYFVEVSLDRYTTTFTQSIVTQDGGKTPDLTTLVQLFRSKKRHWLRNLLCIFR